MTSWNIQQPANDDKCAEGKHWIPVVVEFKTNTRGKANMCKKPFERAKIYYNLKYVNIFIFDVLMNCEDL